MTICVRFVFSRSTLIVLILTHAVSLNAQLIGSGGVYAGGGILSNSNFAGTVHTAPGDFFAPIARELDSVVKPLPAIKQFEKFKFTPGPLNSLSTGQSLSLGSQAPNAAGVTFDTAGVVMGPTGRVKVLDSGAAGTLPAGQGADSMSVSHGKASVILLQDGRIRLGDISTLQRIVPPNPNAANDSVLSAPEAPAR